MKEEKGQTGKNKVKEEKVTRKASKKNDDPGVEEENDKGPKKRKEREEVNSEKITPEKPNKEKKKRVNSEEETKQDKVRTENAAKTQVGGGVFVSSKCNDLKTQGNQFYQCFKDAVGDTNKISYLHRSLHCYNQGHDLAKVQMRGPDGYEMQRALAKNRGLVYFNLATLNKMKTTRR